VNSIGVRPQYTAELASGNPPHLEMVRYRAGDLGYLGLLNGAVDKEELVRMALPANWHVYDCRTGEALGQRQVIRTTFEPKQARVYCLSPKPLAAPRVAMSQTTVRPGQPVKYTVELKGGADSARQVVRLTALNDPLGPWRLVVRDLCSGAKAEATFTVKGGPL
jgi:hypothetical protein